MLGRRQNSVHMCILQWVKVCVNPDQSQHPDIEDRTNEKSRGLTSRAIGHAIHQTSFTTNERDRSTS
ncbi:hypothetical protein KEM48_003061 [Puccinia striiformis f. sp. tritici PST-130]|nr:hypothetical protein H4Q26_002971 [Puccinia striiformis f. sp. tritici PST-130]KAI9609140.1 hypothetical protein KEM48_003061 [Puccinia striiformis f. sp. tritici PST-130]